MLTTMTIKSYKLILEIVLFLYMNNGTNIIANLMYDWNHVQSKN